MLAAAALFAATGCSYFPESVAGLPETLQTPWINLPLRSWLAEDRAIPEAVALCAPPECRPGMVVGVVRLRGEDADVAERLLHDPAPLAARLATPAPPPTKGAKPRQRSVSTIVPLQEGTARGFGIDIVREDGKRHAHGAALARRDGADLRIVLVVGEEKNAVLSAVRRAAAAHLQS
ncbi:hypothetical protein [Microvirga massiliensis]|uniref:hypothetical protein n=1 Tax=Microvirga massiliensis TaxID=1033741 RepID=UPI00062BF068|nr:hypothetical protein [Microvirga massiliensis]